MNPTNTPTTGSIQSSSALVDSIRTWVQYDTQLHNLASQAKTIREQRNELQKSIVDQLRAKALDRTIIDIGSEELKMVHRTEYAPLTYQYVEKCLHEVIPNSDHVKYIIEYMKQKRNTKECYDLRRMQKKV